MNFVDRIGFVGTNSIFIPNIYFRCHQSRFFIYFLFLRLLSNKKRIIKNNNMFIADQMLEKKP